MVIPRRTVAPSFFGLIVTAFFAEGAEADDRFRFTLVR
jgi:hypothetical protein